jgi:enediyne biosynthesis protein E4
VIRTAAVTLLAASTVLAQGIATRGVSGAPRAKFSGKPWPAKFTDVSKSAGFTQRTTYGGVDRIDYIVETSGGGLAAIDVDRDGWTDLFVIDGPGGHHRLYRNRGDGTFTEAAKFAAEWGMGVALGDYNGDGWDDLYVTQFPYDILLRNDKGHLVDATEEAGLRFAGKRWGAGASFFDYDKDGDLDLFVSNYIDFDPSRTPKPGANPNCTWKGMAVACGPRGLPASRHWLFRNDGGKFTDVSAASGIAGALRTYGMTAAAADLDGDGWTDIYVASDSTPSLFFRNLGNGRFREEGLESGIAVNEDGREQAGMGLGIADYNGDGRLDIFKTHFSEDTHVLYRNDGKGQFTDVTLTAGLAVETRYVGWGTALADFDNDGRPDVFFVTGGVYPEAANLYRSPALLFRNIDGQRFEQIGPEMAGAPFAALRSSRGSVVFDYDNDGDLDIAIWNRNEAPALLRNDLNGGGNWLQIDAPLGTRLVVNGHAQEVFSQSSFYSAPGRVLHFGLGSASSADIVVAGRTIKGVAANKRYRLLADGELRAATPDAGRASK